MWPDSPPNAAKCWPSDVLRAGSRRPWGLNRKSPNQIFRRFPRAPVGGLLVAVRAVSSLLFRFLRAICTWRNSGRRRAASFGGPSLRSSPAATRRRRPEGTAVSRFEDVLWAVRAARSSRTAVPRPPAAAKYRQLLMHAVCASAGSSHCMIAPHQRLQVRSRWLFRPGQRSSGCGVLQKQGRRRVFGHTQAPVSPEPRGDVHERACGLEVRLCTAGHTRAQRRTAPRHCGAEVGSSVCGLGVSFAAARTEQQQEEEDEAGERRRRPAPAAKPRGGRREEACGHAALPPTFGRPERD